eukprot:s3817_g2.t1
MWAFMKASAAEVSTTAACHEDVHAILEQGFQLLRQQLQQDMRNLTTEVTQKATDVAMTQVTDITQELMSMRREIAEVLVESRRLALLLSGFQAESLRSWQALPEELDANTEDNPLPSTAKVDSSLPTEDEDLVCTPSPRRRAQDFETPDKCAASEWPCGAGKDELEATQIEASSAEKEAAAAGPEALVEGAPLSHVPMSLGERQQRRRRQVIHKYRMDVDDEVPAVQLLEASNTSMPMISLEDQFEARWAEVRTDDMEFGSHSPIARPQDALEGLHEEVAVLRPHESDMGMPVAIGDWSSHLRMDVLQWLPAREICQSRAVSPNFTNSKELASRLRVLSNLRYDTWALEPPNPSSDAKEVNARACLDCLLHLQQVLLREAPLQMDVLVSDLLWWGCGFYWYRYGTSVDNDQTLHIRAGVAECLSSLYWKGENGTLSSGDRPSPTWPSESDDWPAL